MPVGAVVAVVSALMLLMLLMVVYGALLTLRLKAQVA